MMQFKFLPTIRNSFVEWVNSRKALLTIVGSILSFFVIHGNQVMGDALEKVKAYQEAGAHLELSLLTLADMKEAGVATNTEQFQKDLDDCLDMQKKAFLLIFQRRYTGKFLPSYAMNAFHDFVNYSSKVYAHCKTRRDIPPFIKDEAQVLLKMHKGFEKMPRTRLEVFYYWILAYLGVTPLESPPPTKIKA